MAKINATDFAILKDGEIIAHSTSATISIALDTPDASTKGSGGYAEVIAGQRSWEGSVEGLVDYTGTFGADGLAVLLNNRTSFTVLFSDNTTLHQTYTGTAYITSYEETGDNEQPLSYSVSFIGTGALTIGTV